MPRSKFALALIALATIMLVGCKEPAGIPSGVHAATTHTIYCTTDNFWNPTGYLAMSQIGPTTLDESFIWDTTEITRAYTAGQYGGCPWKVGLCYFQIPGFSPFTGMPACTLFYYQDSHYGSADLLVKAWNDGLYSTPPDPQNYFGYFWTLVGSTDTVATDITHASDGVWYKVALDTWACWAIADSGAAHYGGEPAPFLTGWIYSDTSGGSGNYTCISGTYSGNPPYIKVVYTD